MARLNARWLNFTARGKVWDHFWQDTASGTTQAVSQTDSTAISDGFSAVTIHAAALVDSSPITDADSGVNNTPADLADSSPISTVISGVSAALASLSDTGGMSDALSAQNTANAAQSDSVVISDSVQGAAVTSADLDDALSIDGAFEESVVELVDFEDGLALDDDFSAIKVVSADWSDTMGAGGGDGGTFWCDGFYERLSLADSFTCSVIRATVSPTATPDHVGGSGGGRPRDDGFQWPFRKEDEYYEPVEIGVGLTDSLITHDYLDAVVQRATIIQVIQAPAQKPTISKSFKPTPLPPVPVREYVQVEVVRVVQSTEINDSINLVGSFDCRLIVGQPRRNQELTELAMKLL